MNETVTRHRRTQTQRRDEAEQRMLAAAIELIAEKGFRGLVLGEVGTRAGYSAALPVHYYKTKEALILQVAERILADYSEGLRSNLEHGVHGLAALRAFVHSYVRYAAEQPQKRRALFMITSEAAVDAPLREAIAELSRRGQATLARFIREGQAAAEIEPMVDPDTFGSLVFASLRGIVSLWAVDEKVDLQRLAVALENSIVFSLRSRQPSAAGAKGKRTAA